MLILLLRLGTALLGGALTAVALGLATPGKPKRRSRKPGTWAHGLSLRSTLVHGAACTAFCLLLLPALSGYSGGEWCQGVLLTCLLYGLAVADLRTLRVPLPAVFGGLALRVAYLAALERDALLPMMLGLFAGAGMLSLAALGYEWVRGRAGLGAGDGAVLGLIGAFVGWQGLVPTLLGAATSGLIGGGGALLATRRPLDTPLPFAPFLSAGGWVVYIAQRVGWLPSVGR